MTDYIIKFDDTDIVKLYKSLGYNTPKELIEESILLMSMIREGLGDNNDDLSAWELLKALRETGYLEGYSIGYKEGFEAGQDEGFDDYDSGWFDGYAEAEYDSLI